MSYTRPDYDAADATFSGAAAFTRPDYDAADASWVPPGIIDAYITVASPLGAVQVLAQVDAAAIASVPSPLGAVQVVVWHDFTGQIGDLVTRYLMDLVTPTGNVRVPISSWQSTQQVDESCYAQCVVPACADWLEDINAATDFVIYRAATLSDGSALEVEMVRSVIEAVALDRGSTNYTATLSGYDDALTGTDNPDTAFDRTLPGLRTVSSYNGLTRARCAIDWLLRPGHRAYIEGSPIIVDYINYYGQGSDSYMDVGERA